VSGVPSDLRHFGPPVQLDGFRPAAVLEELNLHPDERVGDLVDHPVDPVGDWGEGVIPRGDPPRLTPSCVERVIGDELGLDPPLSTNRRVWKC
jgi:hypothetical protein